MEPGVPPIPAPAIQYEALQNRSAGLIVFGVLALVVGAFCACAGMLTPMALAMQGMAPAGTPPVDIRAVFLSGALYLVIAGLFITLGIGSIRARRWVRPLMLSVAWTWLIFGAVTVGMWLWIAPNMGEMMQTANPAQPISASAANVIVIFTGVMMVVTQIAMPLAFILFYRSKHVQATLADRDPMPGWTDRCPVPVLTLSVGLAAGAMVLLGMAVYMVTPAFGVLLKGPAAAGLAVFAAVATGWAAWATYKLQPAGWWGTVLLLIALAAAIVPTFLHISPLEYYEAMGVEKEQLRMYESVSGTMINVLTLAMTAAGVGYMVRIRKYFVGQAVK